MFMIARQGLRAWAMRPISSRTPVRAVVRLLHAEHHQVEGAGVDRAGSHRGQRAWKLARGDLEQGAAALEREAHHACLRG